MTDLRMIRIERDFESGTLGVLLVNGESYCVTLEPVDPVPAGVYAVEVYNSPKFGREVLLVKDVPGYEMIEVHPGNTKRDTRGCTVVGQYFGKLRFADAELRAVMNSGVTFAGLMERFKKAGTKGRITIVECY